MAANISFTQGEDFTASLTLMDNAETPAPIDITGDTFEGKIKSIADLSAVLATFTLAVSDGPNGVVSIALTDAETLAVESNVAYNTKGVASATPVVVLFYDIYRIEAGSGDKKIVANGLVTVYPSITYSS